jgi:hypothetical protein
MSLIEQRIQELEKHLKVLKSSEEYKAGLLAMAERMVREGTTIYGNPIPVYAIEIIRSHIPGYEKRLAEVRAWRERKEVEIAELQALLPAVSSTRPEGVLISG